MVVIINLTLECVKTIDRHSINVHYVTYIHKYIYVTLSLELPLPIYYRINVKYGNYNNASVEVL